MLRLSISPPQRLLVPYQFATLAYDIRLSTASDVALVFVFLLSPVRFAVAVQQACIYLLIAFCTYGPLMLPSVYVVWCCGTNKHVLLPLWFVFRVFCWCTCSRLINKQTVLAKAEARRIRTVTLSDIEMRRDFQAIIADWRDRAKNYLSTYSECRNGNGGLPDPHSASSRVKRSMYERDDCSGRNPWLIGCLSPGKEGYDMRGKPDSNSVHMIIGTYYICTSIVVSTPAKLYA